MSLGQTSSFLGQTSNNIEPYSARYWSQPEPEQGKNTGLGSLSEIIQQILNEQKKEKQQQQNNIGGRGSYSSPGQLAQDCPVKVGGKCYSSVQQGLKGNGNALSSPSIWPAPTGNDMGIWRTGSGGMY